MSTYGIREVLAGVWVLCGFGERTVGIVRAAGARYRGPAFDGLDYMPPNAAGEAWLLVGCWRECFARQDAIRAFHEALTEVVMLDQAGITLGDGTAILDAGRAFPGDARGELVPWHAYLGVLALPATRAAIEAQFPSLPGWAGMHMGAPHWLGHGMRIDGARLLSVTPYVRIDFVASGLQVAGLAPPRDFHAWLERLGEIR